MIILILLILKFCSVCVMNRYSLLMILVISLLWMRHCFKICKPTQQMPLLSTTPLRRYLPLIFYTLLIPLLSLLSLPIYHSELSML